MNDFTIINRETGTSWTFTSCSDNLVRVTIYNSDNDTSATLAYRDAMNQFYALVKSGWEALEEGELI